ncbi:MAG: class I SAM-dependent methyltransferase [Acidimicrobiia bacterium]|nr:class I SAM-dependent methyltransferase [Acidimicrobiia bacterium]
MMTPKMPFPTAAATATGRSDDPEVPRPEHGPPSGSFAAKALGRLRAARRLGGLRYALLYGTRMLVDSVRDRLDDTLVQIERRRSVVEPWSIAARRYTVADNVALWNTYDWSLRGEEWTHSEDWKRAIVEHYIAPHVPTGGTVLEIGPGGGRWTDIIRQRSSQVVVLDVSERALSICRERFADASNIRYVLGDGNGIPLPDASVDAIWSFDVFVHINPVNTRAYVRDFQRVLRPGGYAVIHHPDAHASVTERKQRWRSDVTDNMIQHFAAEHGLEVVVQTARHLRTGDLITVMRAPMP